MQKNCALVLTYAEKLHIMELLEGNRGQREVNRMNEIQKSAALPAFTGRNVPVTEIAKAMHKDAQYVRVGLQQGAFKFGYAFKLDGSNEYNYYCPDRKVWEEIGYFNNEGNG